MPGNLLGSPIPAAWPLCSLLVACGGVSDDALVGGSDTVGESDSGTDDGLDPDRPFEPPEPSSALYKAKTFLVGLAPTADEYGAYAEDPAVMPELVDSWMAMPEFEPRTKTMLGFMFQQGAGSDEIGLMMREQNTDIFQQREGRGGVDLEGPMRRSWELTAWDIIDQGRPFTEVATTRTFYMNVPLMMAMAYVDSTPRDDTNAYVEGHSWIEDAYPDLSVSYTQDELIPFSESVDPGSPNYGRFSIGEPDGSAAGTSACEGLQNTFTGRAAVEEVYKYMMGAPFRTTCWSWNGAMANVFEAADLEDRPITVRVAAPGEERTAFWDLDTLRATSELVLGTEYVGFFGTLGFLTQWTTNDANEHRVTANQTLIVGLGQSFDPGVVNTPIDELLDDEMHAAPGSVCFSCHATLDPLRDFFRQSYTYWGSARVEGMGANEVIPEVAVFPFGGVEGRGVGDLGQAIASAREFAPAWTLKMCELVNAGGCSAADPELERIAQVFASSGHDFKVLLRELLTSPVTTYQARTTSWDEHGATVGSAMQGDYCRRVANRSGIHDACALQDELDALPGEREIIAGYARVLSPMGYPRGSVAPDQPIVPTLFGTAGAESLCEALASRFVRTGRGGGGTPPDLPFDPTDRGATMEFYLTRLMGVWSDDARAGEIRDVLDAHWESILTETQDDEIAAQSTFALACSAPQTTSLGL